MDGRLEISVRRDHHGQASGLRKIDMDNPMNDVQGVQLSGDVGVMFGGRVGNEFVAIISYVVPIFWFIVISVILLITWLHFSTKADAEKRRQQLLEEARSREEEARRQQAAEERRRIEEEERLLRMQEEKRLLLIRMAFEKKLLQMPTSSNQHIIGRRITQQLRMVRVDHCDTDDRADIRLREEAHKAGAHAIINMRIRPYPGGHFSAEGDAVVLEMV